MTSHLYIFSTRLSTVFVQQLIILVLMITHILPQNRCLASSNKFGVHMIRSPESNIAPKGDEVQFECELNLEPDRLEWRFLPQDRIGDRKNDFIYIDSNNGYNVTLKERVSKLTVVVAQQTVGVYQCIAWIGASALASLPAKLILATISLETSKSDRILPSMKKGLQQNNVQWRVAPGNSVIIKCGDVISYPPPVWTFYKDTVAVPSSVPQLPAGALILSPVTRRDTGTYYCSALNSITGTELRTSQKTSLIVDSQQRSAPTFLSQVQEEYSAKPGSSIILECPGVGNPTPTQIWSRSDDIIILSSRTRRHQYGLEILNVTYEDQGTYNCQLDNGIAPVLNHKIKLTVLHAPVIVEPPQATLANEGDNLELECIAEGSPEPTISWMINADDTKWDPLIKSVGNKLFIKSVEKRHAGIVQCFAKNEAGETTESNALHVSPKQIPGGPDSETLGLSLTTTVKTVKDHLGKSSRGRKKHKRPIMVPPSRPTITRLNDESVMVRWNVPPNDGLPIQFFKVQYRMLGDPAKKIQKTDWSTANEDIAPHVFSYEVNSLKPDRYYRFRIAAVYSNSDNQLGPTSGKFYLQRGPVKSHLPTPILSLIEPLSETEIMLHWQVPLHSNTVEGFYAYYRPASTAGEYSKATVDGHDTRSFKIDHLEPGTAYEFKLQSFTSSAASDFSAILTKKTLKPSIPTPFIPTVISAHEQTNVGKIELLPMIAAIVGGSIIIFIIFILICFAFKRRNNTRDDESENKAHPDIIQGDSNGFVGSPILKNNRMNGVGSRMTITANPLAQESEKNRNIMELRFLPNTMPGSVINCNGLPPSQSTPSPITIKPTDMQLPPVPHKRSLDRSLRSLNHSTIHPNGVNGGCDTVKTMADGDCGLSQVRSSSMRRSKRQNGTQTSVPSSPRIIRGPSAEILHHKSQPSPLPIRANGAKRVPRLGRAENISSGSLNSIEV